MPALSPTQVSMQVRQHQARAVRAGASIALLILAGRVSAAAPTSMPSVLSVTRESPRPPLVQTPARIPFLHERMDTLEPPLERTYQLAMVPIYKVLLPQTHRTENMALVYCEDLEPLDRRVEAYDARSGRRIWSLPLEDTSAPKWLGTIDGVLVIATIHRVLAVDAITGRVRWTFLDVPRRAGSPAIDPEILPMIRACSISDGTLVVIEDSQRAAGVRVADGEILWRRKLPHRSSGPLATGIGYLAYASRESNRTRIVQLDAASGRDVKTIERKDDREVTWLRVTDARTIVAAGAGWITCHDADSDRLLWEKRDAPENRATLMAADDRRVYASLRAGTISGIDLFSGQQTWQTSLPDAKAEVDCLLTQGRELIVPTARSVHVIDAPSGELQSSVSLPSEFRLLDVWQTESDVLLLGVERPRASQPALRACFIRAATDGHGPVSTQWADLDTGPMGAHSFSVYHDALWAHHADGVTAFQHVGIASQPSR